MAERDGAGPPAVTLLRARGRHTRWLGLAVVGVFLFADPALGHHVAAERLMVALGSLLIMCGGLIRIFCALFIGGWKNRRLAAAGPYALVRNPLYVGSLIATCGVGLATATLTLTVALLGMIAVYYSWTVRREERFLEQRFGDEYRQYLAAVPRWLPRPGQSMALPPEIQAKPRYVLNGIRDITLLLLVPLACEGVRVAHLCGLLPTYYRLW